MYKVQSILFNKTKYSVGKAVKFLMDNGHKYNKVDETDKFYRFRQIEPDYLKKQGYNKVVTKKIGKGIEFIIYYK